MGLSALDSLAFWDEPNATLAAGLGAREVGQYEKSAELLERSVEVARDRAGKATFAIGAAILVGTYTLTGRLDDAAQLMDEAVPIVRRLLGPDMSTTRVFMRAADCSRLRGDFDTALGYLAEARSAAERNRETWIAQSATLLEALIARDLGDLDRAQQLQDKWDPSATDDRLLSSQFFLLRRLDQAGLAARRKDHTHVLLFVGDVLARPDLLWHDAAVEAVDLTSIALVALGHADVCAQLMGAADAERERTGLVVEPPDRPLLDEAREQARSQLGNAWEAEYEKGTATSLDEAVELASQASTDAML